MAHPLVFPLRTYFYPIGNTTPTNLIQDLAPEQSANILLLGCGDPRNIFFTLHCNSVDQQRFPRTLDITCCDIEPAILARNIILFTLILDDEPLTHQVIWEIFYDLYITALTMSVLVRQCKKLVSLAADVASWHTGSYGSVLRVCTQGTLSELCRHWNLYAEFESLPVKRKTAVYRAFSDALHKSDTESLRLSSSRSAGPLQAFAVGPVSEHFHRFWSSGINTHDQTAAKKATLVNPTFVYSIAGEGFAVHYGTDPFSSFHLAPAFIDHSQGLPDYGASKPCPHLYTFVRETFRDWCITFKAVATKDVLRLRFFTGDALALCSSLQYRAKPSFVPSTVYATRWKATVLELNGGDYDSSSVGPAPLAFDVIDTSNLTDHVGLLNILIATIPILSRNAYSSLYTETLLPTGSDLMQGFLELMCGDLSTMAMLLDLVPLTFVSHFASISNVHELMLHASHRETSESPQFHERMCWKIASLLKPRETSSVALSIYLDPTELARFLYSVYLRMFADEDMSSMMQIASSSLEKARQKLRQSNLIHYTRATFVELLRIVKERATTDWLQVMDILLDHIDTDATLLMGSNYSQDLYCQLHLRGIYSADTFRPNKPILARAQLPGWTGAIPPVIFLSLVIPRQKLKVLEILPLEELGTPLLQFELLSPGFHNMFSGIQTAFGTITNDSGSDQHPVLTFEEDLKGWAGSADLVVGVALPTWIFSHTGINVSLSVRCTVATMHLMSKLGSRFSIFSTSATDKKHVFFSRTYLNTTKEVLTPPSSSAHSLPTTNHATVALNDKCQRVSQITVKATIDVPAEQKVLAASPHVAVLFEQVLACGIVLKFGGVERYVQFPIPIDGTRTKLRIARKSHYIEVIVPPSETHSQSGSQVNNFPLLFCKNNPTIWNIHRLQLARLPSITVNGKHIWFNPQISLMLSEAERALITSTDPNYSPHSKALASVKETLHCLFVRFTGIQGGSRASVFALNDHEGSGGIYAVFFLSHLKLDLAAHTFVLDGHVLPITLDLPQHFLQALANLGSAQIVAVGEEMRAWKRLLPVLTERCRQNWLHRADCAYIKKGRVPLSFAMGESPICYCGQGKDVEDMLRIKDWAKFAPRCTRVAISPLYAVSYMESIVGTLKSVSAGVDKRENPSQHKPMDPAKLRKRAEERLTTQPSEGCQKCGSTPRAALQVCGRCKKVRYCSSACQKGDWKSHKSLCHHV